MWASLRRWQGVILCIVALVATVWLGVTNQLILYIHPRYIIFTVIMAVLGLAFVLGSFITKHEHDHDEEKPRRLGAVLSVVATVLTIGLAVGLIIVPPATLTTATADQRVVNSGSLLTGGTSVAAAASVPAGASAKFTVADWASLLRQTSNQTFYRNKAANLIGFVTLDKEDSDNVFFLTRFVITCCAVDAQPVAVPVYLPGWKNSFHNGAWVHVTGSFDTNPSTTSKQPISLISTTTTPTEQPGEPYLY